MANHAKGRKASGSVNSRVKSYNSRHGSRGTVRSCNAVEKAIETQVRQAGKREVREALADLA